jgi:hypothetical protein
MPKKKSDPSGRTLVEVWGDRLKNNPVVAVLIILSSVIIGTAAVIAAVKALVPQFIDGTAPEPCSAKGIVGKYVCHPVAPGSCDPNGLVSRVELGPDGKTHNWYDGNNKRGSIAFDFPNNTFVINFDSGGKPAPGTMEKQCRILRLGDYNWNEKL